MGKKKGKNKGSDGVSREDIKREKKLQAVLLADSFTETFRPLSKNRPKVLLPLVNIPMLEYTLEFLASSGVDEVFVFCVSNAEQVGQYLEQSKWMLAENSDKASLAGEGPTVQIVTSTACTSAGDALREIDNSGVITSDPFVLISGDVISNIDLQAVIRTHEQRRKQNGIMTMVLKTVSSQFVLMS